MPPKQKSRKREAEVVDLISEDEDITRPTKRTTTSASSKTTDTSVPIQQADNVTWIADDADIDENITSSQDNSSQTANYQLYGILAGKIVGVRFYRGVATFGERVLIRREPSNQYDANAIRVDNVSSQQIGHIPRGPAAKLAKYLDNTWLVIEGTLSGRIGEFDAPIELSLYGPDPTSPEGIEVVEKMKADKLPLNIMKERAKAEKQAEKDKQREEKLRLAEMRRAAAGDGNAERNLGVSTFASHSQPGFGDQSMQDIIDNAQRFDPRRATSESYGQDEELLRNMPFAEQPASIKTDMLPYQRQALFWLLDRENVTLPPPGSKDTVQLWKRHNTNAKAFTNIATNFSTTETPSLAQGGILADDMGLGKTLEMISLIVADKEQHGKGTTLIVAPLSVMSNWTDQLARHVHKKDALNAYIYHGKQAVALKPHELSEYDVVITTYQTLASDYLPRGSKTAPSTRKSGLYSMTWRRIILDEGHIIRNPQSKGAAAVVAVDAQKRWVLTGTPIVNTLKDLYSLLRFVRIKGGLEQMDIFNSALIRPLNQGDASAMFLLKAVMKSFTLRRKKEMSFIDLKLPPLEEYIQRLDFTDNERKRYKVLEDEAKGVMAQYMDKSEAGARIGNAFQTLLEILLRMRQCCNHWQLCGERVTKLLEELSTKDVVALTPENVKALQDILQIRIESQEECAICLEQLHDPVITHCGHSFGRECITKTIETQHKCPMCRAEIKDDSYLVSAANECGDEEGNAVDIDCSSSKVDALLKILEATRNEGKGEKTIIFSQWTRFLDIVEAKLVDRGYSFTRLDGTMNAAKRDASLHALENDVGCTIMLASLGVCAVGLNLVAANNIILSDSWWAPAIEDQAVDRVHRLGQKKPTRVFRLVMDKSIEDTVLDIQQKKRALMKMALSENKSKRDVVKQGRLADIQKLLGWKS